MLAINGQSLVNATLPQAVYMLSTAGDVVQLKIRKATSRPRKGRAALQRNHRYTVYNIIIIITHLVRSLRANETWSTALESRLSARACLARVRWVSPRPAWTDYKTGLFMM